jgi:hypothetical protein
MAEIGRISENRDGDYLAAEAARGADSASGAGSQGRARQDSNL